MKETREDDFLKSAIASMEEKKLSTFKDAVSKYKKFTDLDKWKINVFKTIHDKLDVQDNPDDFLGD